MNQIFYYCGFVCLFNKSILKFLKIKIVKKKVKPTGALEYQVEKDETIEKIALKWNTVPSEIKRLNRLSTRVIFPGKITHI